MRQIDPAKKYLYMLRKQGNDLRAEDEEGMLNMIDGEENEGYGSPTDSVDLTLEEQFQ